MKRTRGFTLLELMIVVAIVAILAAFALSNYSKQVRKSRRAEAKQVMTGLSLLEEKYRSEHTTYPASAASIGGSTTASYYTVTVPAGGATSYTIQAAAIGDQAKDTGCTTLVLASHSGTLSKTPTDCW